MSYVIKENTNFKFYLPLLLLHLYRRNTFLETPTQTDCIRPQVLLSGHNQPFEKHGLCARQNELWGDYFGVKTYRDWAGKSQRRPIRETDQMNWNRGNRKQRPLLPSLPRHHGLFLSPDIIRLLTDSEAHAPLCFPFSEGMLCSADRSRCTVAVNHSQTALWLLLQKSGLCRLLFSSTSSSSQLLILLLC